MKILSLTRYIIILVLAGFAIGGTAPADAARQGDPVQDRKTFSLESPIANPLIKRMQAALKKAGYYKGPISGSINSQTEAAIHSYQRRENMEISGIVTEQLVIQLESSVKVQSLLQQLQRQRLLKMKAAREALMQSPATRRLLADTRQPKEVADATRDPAPCFATPDPRCLLEEASQSARSVFKDELRYWALSEILVAQAKAGLVEKAMNTIRRIDDPRLMIVALRDIAEAQARSGRPVEALAAAEIIPNALKRAEALAAIATIQARTPGPANRRSGARRTLDMLFKTLNAIDDPLKRIALQAQGATILYKSGDATGAWKTLAGAHKNANGLTDNKTRSVALRHVASAMADIDRPEQALEILKILPELSEHTPVLVSAAAAQALAGHADLALATASTIETVRYRAVVLGRIAVAQATAGQMAAADETLEKAFAAIKLIELPFAQAYAHEQMAKALMSIAKLQTGKSAKNAYRRAVGSASRISDNMLRARTLWAISNSQQISGDRTQAAKTEGLAETATASIRSTLTVVWMFCNIATDHMAAAAPAQAQKAFARALKLSKSISNPWGRARALARLASTQVDLSTGE